jgi:hypothetical protein
MSAVTLAYGAIVCPRCRDINLHHERVRLWRRPEDGDGDSVLLSAKDPSDEPQRVRRPAREFKHGRRHLIEIDFRCEHCIDELFTLRMAQHKGQTLIEWVR